MKIHIVQKGDTLWKIAKKYGVDFEELKKVNAQLSNPDMIMPGMKIKVPAGGTAVKKEMPKMPQAGVKGVPKKEMPKELPKKPKEVKKEVPKEMPQKMYQPVMPQSLPEIDINNYYMMNMSQMQAQVQQQPKEEESPEMVMPIEGGVPQPMYPHFYCPPPVMPICDPCYPYPMMPYVHGMMSYPYMPMGGQMPMHGQMPMGGQMPMHGQMPMGGQMPMYGQMPAVMGAADYGAVPAEHPMMPHHWGEESSSSPSMEMMHHHHGFHHNPHGPYQNPTAMMGEADYTDPPAMPPQGWNQPYGGGYPMMPSYPYGMQQMGMPQGHMPYGQENPYEQTLPGAGTPYPTMPRVEEGEDEE
ncbi:SafA/ExsA family spore coat assembly protein [Siminovitchia sediminis]|uniref:SafA/ExsA family spore coat assembly protein n=1 Tax=Siminovitchia sediminis TaxID=1274353 RepID=UPI003AA957F6